MATKFSEARLINIRRLRKARRMFSQTPLFAFDLMREQYPSYTWDTFLDDLRRRSKYKKKTAKSPLRRYGRYFKMQELLATYQLTKNAELAIRAITLRNNMTRPYRLFVKVGKEAMEFSFPPTVSYSAMEGLNTSCQQCRTMDEVNKLVEKFRSTLTPF